MDADKPWPCSQSGGVEASAAGVLLVHGAWHNATCWQLVLQGLRAAGIHTRAIDLPGHGESVEPLGDLYGDAAAVVAELEAFERDVLLVGHSLGGAVITEAAGLTSQVSHLMYVAACVPDLDQTAFDVTKGRNDPELDAAMRWSEDGTQASIDPAVARELFYPDCPVDLAARMIANLGPQPLATVTQPLRHPAWQTLPSTYVVCSQDRIIRPDLQREMAQRIGANIIELASSHSPFASQPDALVALVTPLVARSAQNSGE